MSHPRRSFVQYSFFRSGIILFIIIVSYWIVDQLNINLDITASQRYTLSEESADLLANLQEPLYIYYLEPSSMLNRPGMIHIDQLLKQIARTNKLIHYENFAVHERPLLVSQFTEGEQRIEAGSLLVKMGNQQRVIESYRLLDYYIGNSGAPILMANQTEKLLMETIEQFFHQKTYHIFVVDNHGEFTLNNFMTTQRISLEQLLTSRGYHLTQGNLMATNLETIDTLFFLAPTSDLNIEELRILDRWLESGKNIYLSLNFQGNVPQNWQTFLEKWGIILHDAALIEKDSSKILAIDPEGFSFLSTLINHEMTWPLIKQNLRPIFRLPLYINLKPISQQRITQTIIAQSSQYTEILTLENNTLSMKPNPSPQEIPLALAVEYTEDTHLSGRLYFSSGDVAYINYNYANELLLLQAVDWLHKQVSRVHILPKNLYQAPMHSIQANQAILLGLLITIVIPLLLIFSGISIYFYRKKK